MMPFVREPSLVNRNIGQNQSRIFYFYIVCMKRATFQNWGGENKEIHAYSILIVTLKSLLWTAPKQHSHGCTANSQAPQRGCNSPAQEKGRAISNTLSHFNSEKKHNFCFDLCSISNAQHPQYKNSRRTGKADIPIFSNPLESGKKLCK